MKEKSMKRLITFVFGLSIVVYLSGTALVQGKVGSASSPVLAREQVNSQCEVDFGRIVTCVWSGGMGSSFTFVPADITLQVTTATFAYFPAGAGTVGRADLAGRDATGSVVWRTQIVYIDPKKTVHLTFPGGLLLPAGGYVEIAFTSDGPGTIDVSIHGQLTPSP